MWSKVHSNGQFDGKLIFEATKAHNWRLLPHVSRLSYRSKHIVKRSVNNFIQGGTGRRGEGRTQGCCGLRCRIMYDTQHLQICYCGIESVNASIGSVDAGKIRNSFSSSTEEEETLMSKDALSNEDLSMDDAPAATAIATHTL